MESEIMAWNQFAIFFIGVFGLFIWNRTESRADLRHTDAKIEAMRQETKSLIESIREESKDFREEIKDFHGRLCKLEEQYFNWRMENEKR